MDCIDETYIWPRPYLIGLHQRAGAVRFGPMPGSRSIQTDVQGIGAISMSVGGLLWDIPWQAHDAMGHLVTAPVRVRADFRSDRALPDFMHAENALIVSEKVRRVIEPVAKRVEFIPLELELTPPGTMNDTMGGGEIVGGYYWMNCWNRLDLVDQDRSVLTGPPSSYPPHISRRLICGPWWSLVLKPMPTSAHLFSLSGVFGNEIYISESLCEKLRLARCNLGFMLKPLNSNPTSEEHAALGEASSALNAPLWLSDHDG